MMLLIQTIIVILTISQIRARNCDENGIMIYDDMKCEPLNNQNNCPTHYKCDGIQIADKCYYQGKSVQYGEPLPKNSVGLSCQFGCFCNKKDNVASVSCAQGSCAENSGLPPTPGCYRGYNLDYCCSSGEICPPFNNETRCTVDGVEYREGERFVPKATCHTCVCQKGWTGAYVAPFCKRYGCDVQIRNQREVQHNCGPVYLKRQDVKKCCPDLWVCPDGKEVIEGNSNGGDLKCKFGETIVNLGGKFKKEVEFRHRPLKIECECKIPPLVTCVEI